MPYHQEMEPSFRHQRCGTVRRKKTLKKLDSVQIFVESSRSFPWPTRRSVPRSSYYRTKSRNVDHISNRTRANVRNVDLPTAPPISTNPTTTIPNTSALKDTICRAKFLMCTSSLASPSSDTNHDGVATVAQYASSLFRRRQQTKELRPLYGDVPTCRCGPARKDEVINPREHHNYRTIIRFSPITCRSHRSGKYLKQPHISGPFYPSSNPSRRSCGLWLKLAQVGSSWLT